jgi:hypothetical protein
VTSRSDRAWRTRSRLDALVGDQGLGVRQRLQDGRGAAMLVCLALGEQLNHGLPPASQTACSLEFRPPLVRPIRWGTALFDQTRRGAMRLERAWVDHRGLCSPAFGGQRREDAVERADPTPAQKTFVLVLVRTLDV